MLVMTSLSYAGSRSGGGGGPPPGPVGIPYANAEGLSEVSDTGASWLDVVTLSVPDTDFGPNEDMIGFWSVSGQSSSATSEIKARVTLGGSDIFTEDGIFTPKEVSSPVDYMTFGGIFRHQPGPTPSSAAYKIQVARGAGAATFKGKDGRLSLLRLGDDDHYSETLARQTYTDTTANQTASNSGTLTFTPATSGDYVIIASCVVDGASSAGLLCLELTDGTTTTQEVLTKVLSSTERTALMLMLPLSAVSGSKTVNLKFRQASSGNPMVIAISEIRMVAIREDRFANVYKNRITSHAGGSGNTTYVATATQTFTPAATDHLTVAAGLTGSNSTGTSVMFNYDDGGTQVNELIRENIAAPAGSDNGLPVMAHRLAAYAASSRTQSIGRKGESGAVTNLVQRGAMIATFDLGGL